MPMTSARLDDDLAGARLLARFADVRAHRGRRGKRHDGTRRPSPSTTSTISYLTTASASSGSCAPVMMRTHSPEAMAPVDASGADLGDDGKLHRALLGRRLEIGRMQGESVHGGVGERRDVDVAAQIGGRDATDRVENRHALGRHGRLRGKARARAPPRAKSFPS